jgi:uncharacterized membrane protein (DUF2068 family)
MKTSNGKLLRVIAVFKFLKATMLIVLGVGALRLLHKDVGDVVEGWAETLGIDPDGRFVSVALAKAAHLRPDQIRNLGLGSFVYAALFLVEGTGLWLQQRWGEWFTVILTGSFVPVEIYEIWRRPAAVKVAVLAINLGIAGYLIYRIRSRGVGSGA